MLCKVQRFGLIISSSVQPVSSRSRVLQIVLLKTNMGQPSCMTRFCISKRLPMVMLWGKATQQKVSSQPSTLIGSSPLNKSLNSFLMKDIKCLLSEFVSIFQIRDCNLPEHCCKDKAIDNTTDIEVSRVCFAPVCEQHLISFVQRLKHQCYVRSGVVLSVFSYELVHGLLAFCNG